MDMRIRVEAGMEALRWEMARFVDQELDKRKEEFAAISKKVVKDFDFEKELRDAFEYQARSRIQDMIRVECGKAAALLLQDWDIKVIIEPKKGGA